MEMIFKLLSLKMMKEKGSVFSNHTHIKKLMAELFMPKKKVRKFSLMILISLLFQPV